MTKKRNRIWRKGITLLVALALLTGMIPFCGKARTEAEETKTLPHLTFTVSTTGGKSSNNISGHEYTWYASDTVNSYLERNADGTYIRVEAVQSDVYVEKYSHEFEYLSTNTLEMELPLFGGYFSGKNYRFLVFGQENPEESDDVEVLRIVKYDRSWNRLDDCSVLGANTTIPFRSGSLRMTEQDGKLYLHTSHQMYASAKDGKNHQANMTFVLDEEEMEITQSWSGVMNVDYGYVSHSFNQFVATDGTNLYRLDHGDAYPRAVVLTKCSTNAITKCTNQKILPIAGTVGANYTGVAVGGFELAGDRLVSVGNSVDQTAEEYDTSGQRNIFVISTDTGLSSSQTTWLTEYENEGVVVGNPHLVKVSEKELYVLWEEAESSSSASLRTVKIAKINSDGQLQGEISGIYARLSGCQPIYTQDGELVWYVTNSDSPVFYHVSTEKLSEYKFAGKYDLGECQISLTPSEFEYDGYQAYKPEVSVFYGTYELQAGTDYQVTYSKNTSVGTAQVVVKGLGIFGGSVTREFEIIRKQTPTPTPTPTSTATVKPSASPDSKATMKPSDSPDSTATLPPSGTGTPSGGLFGTPTPAPSGKPTVNPSSTPTAKPQRTPEGTASDDPSKVTDSKGKVPKVSGLKVINKKNKALTIKWKKVKEADGYQIQIARNRAFTKGKSNKTSSGTKLVIKCLKQRKKKTDYYVRVRAYCNTAGGKAYGKWSGVKKFKQ